MLNGVNITYAVVIFANGAVLLAAIYHTILYFHRKTAIVGYYSTYLWATFLFAAFRIIYPYETLYKYRLILVNLEEILQMIAFAMYIRFMGLALDLDRIKEKYVYYFAHSAKYIILAYAVVQVFIAIVYKSNVPDLNLKTAIRVYLLNVGFFLLSTVMSKRKERYYHYLSAGAIAMIFLGFISSAASLMKAPLAGLDAIAWLMIGFYFDIIFFSSAIGYRLKTEALEKENALRTVLHQSEVLQQKEMEKLQVIYDTREQERARIAKDLHDDVGSTLSGIALYSHLAQQQIDGLNLNAAAESLGTMQKTATQMVSKLNDIIWTVSPDNDNMEAFINKLKEYGTEMTTSKNMQFNALIAEECSRVNLSIEQKKNIYMICKEAINNSVKYSGCSAIELKAIQLDGHIEFTVADNGIGFDICRIKKGNGLNNFDKRAEEIDAEVKIVSNALKGTAVHVICKIT